MVDTIVCKVGTIMCDIGTITVKFYLLEIPYPHRYCRITLPTDNTNYGCSWIYDGLIGERCLST